VIQYVHLLTTKWLLRTTTLQKREAVSKQTGFHIFQTRQLFLAPPNKPLCSKNARLFFLEIIKKEQAGVLPLLKTNKSEKADVAPAFLQV